MYTARSPVVAAVGPRTSWKALLVSSKAHYSHGKPISSGWPHGEHLAKVGKNHRYSRDVALQAWSALASFFFLLLSILKVLPESPK